jgi:hypothetical protein
VIFDEKSTDAQQRSHLARVEQIVFVLVGVFHL